jgi:hypothetical protein
MTNETVVFLDAAWEAAKAAATLIRENWQQPKEIDLPRTTDPC